MVFVMLCDLFFFFQAEDGIRDSSVTGVQTCALPILTLPFPYKKLGRHRECRRTPSPRIAVASDRDRAARVREGPGRQWPWIQIQKAEGPNDTGQCRAC